MHARGGDRLLVPVLGAGCRCCELAAHVVETGAGAGAGCQCWCCELAVHVVETGCWCWCWCCELAAHVVECWCWVPVLVV